MAEALDEFVATDLCQLPESIDLAYLELLLAEAPDMSRGQDVRCSLVRMTVSDSMATAGQIETAALSQSQHWPQIHQAEMRHLTWLTQSAEFMLQEFDIKIDIIRGDNAPTERLQEIVGDLLELGRIRYIPIGDAMNIRGRHFSPGVD